MDVRLAPSGCLNRVGAVLSLGLLPLLQRSQQRQFPAALTDDGMTLRKGTSIPWSAFTRIRVSDLYVQKVHMNTVYELWHTSGRVHFSARQLEDPQNVVQFILRHLPPQIEKVQR